MDTASFVSEERDSYDNQISEVKREIERRFRELIECLRERERKLLNELDAMLNTFKKARDKHIQTITELEQTLKFIQDTIQSESPKEIQYVVFKRIESKRASFSSEFTGKRISIELDKSVLGLAENLGRVIVTECSAEVSINKLRNQLPGGRMSHSVTSSSLPGYPHNGTITIQYLIPAGVQKEYHPNPGVPYPGTSRTAFLPDNEKGRKVLNLLQVGFDRSLIFTVGTSKTSGMHNVVIWNGIHHKTTVSGRYGYPDIEYLDRVLADLKDKGIQ